MTSEGTRVTALTAGLGFLVLRALLSLTRTGQLVSSVIL